MCYTFTYRRMIGLDEVMSDSKGIVLLNHGQENRKFIEWRGK